MRFPAIVAAALLVSWSAAMPAAEPDAQRVLNSGGFLVAHPDLRWRREGLMALEAGRAREAFTYFRRAARYADKPSQAMVAELLWTGRGVPRNRPLAYAWMDVAAERAYVPFVAKRERYWEALDAAERNRALVIGRPLFAEYRDAVAKERLERELAAGRRQVTGSRVGAVGNLQVMLPLAGDELFVTVDGARYYADKYWEPDEYWAWQDSIWKDPPTGTVSVKPLEVVDDAGEDDR